MDMTDDDFDQLLVQDRNQAFEVHIEHLESISAQCDAVLDMFRFNAWEDLDPFTCMGMFEAMYEPIICPAASELGANPCRRQSCVEPGGHHNITWGRGAASP